MRSGGEEEGKRRGGEGKRRGGEGKEGRGEGGVVQGRGCSLPWHTRTVLDTETFSIGNIAIKESMKYTLVIPAGAHWLGHRIGRVHGVVCEVYGL